MQKRCITYLLARLAIGMSLFGHGLIRLTKLSVFAAGMTKEFSKSLLPESLVYPFGLVLPFVEAALGIMLLTGLYIDLACVAGVFVMLLLILGSSFLEQWNNIFTQVIYAVYLAGLYRYSAFNDYSLDRLRRHSSQNGKTKNGAAGGW